MIRLNVDFTSGDGATFSNWIGFETLNTIRDDSDIRRVNSKENPVELAESKLKKFRMAKILNQREIYGYNIYIVIMSQ